MRVLRSRSAIELLALVVGTSCTTDYESFAVGGPDAVASGGTGVSVASSTAGATGGAGTGGATVGSGGAAVSSSAASTSGDASSAAVSTSAASTGSGGSGATVPCNSQTCNPGQVCCFDSDNLVQIGCAAPGGCGGYAELACQGPGDCAGATCCGHWTGTTWTAMACQSTCAAADERIICGGDASMCTTACTASVAAAGYYWCT